MQYDYKYKITKYIVIKWMITSYYGALNLTYDSHSRRYSVLLLILLLILPMLPSIESSSSETLTPLVTIEEEVKDQSLKLVIGQPWVLSIIDFIFLATANEGGWPVLSITVSSSHWQCVVRVLIIAGLARGTGGSEI